MSNLKQRKRERKKSENVMKLQAALFVLVIQLIGKFTPLIFFSKVE